MTTLRGHFDGKVIVPDEPVDLPLNVPLVIHVELASKFLSRSPSTGKSDSVVAERINPSLQPTGD